MLAFLESVKEESKREDCYEIMNMMQEVTGEQPRMWGPSIIGYGSYHYKYESGREGDWMRIGFSPRKENISIYLMSGVEKQADLLAKVGKYKMGKSCFYIKRLADVDVQVLQQMMVQSLAELKKMWG